MLNKIICIVSFILYSSHTLAQFEVPPQEKYKTQRSGLFEVVYNAQQQELADFYLDKLLEAERILRKDFELFPSKVIVVLNDKTDVTNGYATRIPYPHLMIYPVIPGPTESLADYGDWVLEFLVHELVHILNFEPATGIARYLRPFFGNILAPNILLPQWWKEGIAVYFESKTLGKGRLHSPSQDAQIRAWVLNQKLHEFDLAEVNESLPTWPRGMRPYLFGSLFWAHFADRFEPQTIDQLNQSHGGRLPYFLNGASENIVGQSYESLYQEAINSTQTKALAQIQDLQKIPPTQHLIFQNPYLFSTLPSVSPSGQWMAFVGVDRRDRRFLKIYEKQNGQFRESRSIIEIKNDENAITSDRHEAPDSGSIQRISWFQQGPKMVYDKIDAVNSIQRFSDLYLYDLELKKTTRLTHSGRAREATVAPSDQRIAYVETSSGKTKLNLMDLETRKTQTLFAANIGERISTPVFFDEDHILFALRKSPGTESLYLYSILTETLKKIEAAGNQARYPVINHQDIYYLSAANGTYNIYRAPRTELENQDSHKPTTHTITGLTSFTVDPTDEALYFSEITADGPQIKQLKLSQRLSPTAQLPQIQGLFQHLLARPQTLAPEKTEDSLPAIDTQSSPTKDSEEYRPISYLMPQYWIPFLATSSTTGGMVFQATTAGYDPLKKHNYGLTLSYDTLLGKMSASGQYLNTQNKVPFLVLASELNSFLGDLENTVVDQNFQLSLLPDMWHFNRYSSLQMSWKLNSRKVQQSEIKRSGPSLFASYIRLTQGGDQLYPTDGKSFYAGVTRYLPEQGYLDHHQFLLGGSFYSDALLPERHAWFLRLNMAYIPESISDIYGAQTESFTLNSDAIAPLYLMRGLNTGEIFGRSLAVLNAEYRFPLKAIYQGNGTRPYFLRELWGALVLDAAATKGRVLSLKENRYARVDLDRVFTSLGGEIHLETNLGYLFPMGFVLGYFYTPNAFDGPQNNARLSLQFSL